MSASLPAPANERSPSEDAHRFPSWLAQFIVEQDTARYTAIDQAVWRFVLLQMYDRLKHTAHPAYAQGLADSGISCEHIPSVREMNACLSRMGWGAVCVDGFIPPRAFQAFQAARILPIAAEIRSPEHLPYTPAPDIIHEAAGHAPILRDATYAQYIRTSGEVASRAFSSKADKAVYDAIFALSALKEDPDHNEVQLDAAERSLSAALASVTQLSEAARVARLYWWTAEYGLVGTPADYKLYGAGLLSSLWESHSCHDPSVKKLPLSAECTHFDYDITQAQPQLFVARDFEHLLSVLDDVDGTLAHRIGGSYAIRTALAAGEVATVRFDANADVVGVITSAQTEGDVVEALQFAPGAQFATNGIASERSHTESYVVLGPLNDGTTAKRLASGAWRRHCQGTRLCLDFASGLRVQGDVLERISAQGDAGIVRVSALQVGRGDDVLFNAPTNVCSLTFRGNVLTAEAGSRYDTESTDLEHAMYNRPRVPKLRSRSAATARLNQLYGAMLDARSEPTASMVARVTQLHGQLTSELSTEWLLRWHLLDCLQQARQQGALTQTLERELEALELHYHGRHPIAMGLRYFSGRSA